MDNARIIVIGASTVGKTALLERYLHNEFNDAYRPTLEQEHHKKLTIDSTELTMRIIDTGGMEDVAAKYISDKYLNSNEARDCFLLCFALDDRASFEYIQRVVEQIGRVKKTAFANLPVIIVGCKGDIQEGRQVSEKDIEALTQSRIPYFETSAKKGSSVADVFQWLMKSLLLHQKVALEKSGREALSLSLVDACACPSVFPKIIKKKLRSKAPSAVNAFVGGVSPLQGALSRPSGLMRRQVVQILLAAGADPFLNPPPQSEGQSVISWLIANRDAEGLGELLKCGVSEERFAAHKIDGNDIIDVIIDGGFESFPAAMIHMIIKRVTESARLSSRVCNRVARTEFSFNSACKLGSGGFGHVYPGIYRSAPAAIKQVDESLHPENSAFDLTSLRRELAVLSLVRGENLLKYYGYCYEEPNYYIITELASSSLKSFIDSGKLAASDWHTKTKIARDICQGMIVLHTCGIAHRDLKTENILMFKQADGSFVTKIADFGISRAVSPCTTSQTRAVGTSNYMAPELLEKTEIQANAQLLKSDVYGYGYLLWALCSNEEPHQGQTCASVLRSLDASKKKSIFGKYQTPLKIPASCPRLWKKLITSCWEYDPAARPNFEIILSLLSGGDQQKVSRKKKGMSATEQGPTPDSEPKPKKKSSLGSQPSAPLLPGTGVLKYLGQAKSHGSEAHLDKEKKKTAHKKTPSSPALSFDPNPPTTSLAGSGSALDSFRKAQPIHESGKKFKSTFRRPLKDKKHRTNEDLPVGELPSARRPSSANPTFVVRSPSFPPPRLLSPRRMDSPDSSPRDGWRYLGQEDVSAWLDANDFSGYKAHFFEHEINMESVFDLTREDLREMGIRKVGVILNILRAARRTAQLYHRDDSIE